MVLLDSLARVTTSLKIVFRLVFQLSSTISHPISSFIFYQPFFWAIKGPNAVCHSFLRRFLWFASSSVSFYLRFMNSSSLYYLVVFILVYHRISLFNYLLNISFILLPFALQTQPSRSVLLSSLIIIIDLNIFKTSFK